MKWVNLYQIARQGAFVYYEAYVNAQNQAVGWITKASASEADPYRVFYSDGHNQTISKRGTWEHARDAVFGMHRHFAGKAGGIQMAILELAARQGWHINVHEDPGVIFIHEHGTGKILGMGRTLSQALDRAAIASGKKAA